MCREIATASVGMECCYAIVDAALDKLSHLNESVIDCAICLSMIDVDDEEGSFTARCYHSFHNSCLFKWVQQLRHTWMADNFAEDSVMIRHVASCRSEAQTRVSRQHSRNCCGTCEFSVTELCAQSRVQARAEVELRSELEAVKLQIESLQQEIASYKAEIARTPNEDGRNDAALAELAGKLRECEAALVRCVTAREGGKAKVRNAAAKREEAEVKLAQQQDKVTQAMRDTRPTVGCPVCRVPVEWTDHREEQFTAWCAGAAASGAPDPAEDETAASELDAATKAYLSTFRARMAAITAKQREAGGIIDPFASQGIVVGDNPAASPTGGSGGK